MGAAGCVAAAEQLVSSGNEGHQTFFLSVLFTFTRAAATAASLSLYMWLLLWL
jgi:hypothetical protein